MWCAQTFQPIFRLLAIFNRNFAKIVSQLSKNENYLAHLKVKSLLKKNYKNGIKSTHKQRHNTCSNYDPSNEQRADLGA